MSNQQRIVEHYGDPTLWYAGYPVRPELRCGRCGQDKTSKGERCCGVAYKNGVPYNCNCDLKQAPYSLPYAVSCKCGKCLKCKQKYKCI